MSEPLVLVILLGTSPDPTTDGMMAAARRALGPDAIVLADTSPVATDEEALAIGARVRARAVARVGWAGDSQSTARLHVHVAPADEWADDELRFVANDAPSEKGRTVGYALATMVQRIERERAEERERELTPTKGASGAEPTLGAAAPADPSARDEAQGAPSQRASSADFERRFDVMALGTGALGGGATSAGGAGAIRWWPVSRVGFRAAMGARAGALTEVDASTMTLFAAAGPGYRVPIGRSLELGARTDFVFLQHSVTRRHPIATTTHARWLAAVDLVVEASLSFGPHAALVAGLGAEVAFGTTAVSVGGVPAADIPPARAIAEAGARFRF